MKSEIRQVKSKEQIGLCETQDASLTSRSGADVYITRFGWKLPPQTALLDVHPASKRPLWIEIVAAAGNNLAQSASLFDHADAVGQSWPLFLQRMSW